MDINQLHRIIQSQNYDRIQEIIERRERDDSKQYQQGKVIGYNRTNGLWQIQINGNIKHTRSLTNSAVKIGQTVTYYRGDGDAYGYFDAVPIG